MKKIAISLLLIIALASYSFAETVLGANYQVIRKDSPYAAQDGDMNIKLLQKGQTVRLIKDDSLAETAALFPLRILVLLFTFEPRGNWLVEDDNGNRGYMWDSDLELMKKR